MFSILVQSTCVIATLMRSNFQLLFFALHICEAGIRCSGQCRGYRLTYLPAEASARLIGNRTKTGCQRPSPNKFLELLSKIFEVEPDKLPGRLRDRLEAEVCWPSEEQHGELVKLWHSLHNVALEPAMQETFFQVGTTHTLDVSSNCLNCILIL